MLRVFTKLFSFISRYVMSGPRGQEKQETAWDVICGVGLGLMVPLWLAGHDG